MPGRRLFDDLEAEGVHSLSDSEFFSPMRERLEELGHHMDDL